MSKTSIHLISGEVFDFSDPMAATITTHDVAHALARISRYGGHVADTYSVGQHTLLTYQLVYGWYEDFRHCLGALHHDDPEIITGDWTTPMKNWIRELGVDYGRMIEGPIELAICKQLDLVVDDLHAGVVKNADAVAYEIEAKTLKPNGYDKVLEVDDDLMKYGQEYLDFLLELDPHHVEMIWMTIDEKWRSIA